MANTILRRKLVIPKPRIEITLFGSWEETMRVMGSLGRVVKQCSLKAQMKVCREIAQKVKGHLRNQDLGWRPLNPEYAERKEEAGFDSRTLIGAGTYYNNIDVWSNRQQKMAFVGVKKGIRTISVTGKRSKLDVATIAYIHEFGGRKIPKRALWNPTIQEIGGAQGIKAMYTRSLYYWLRMNKIPVESFRRIF